ncbi:asparagine synthetase domain-containing protein 1 isoform X1, partial [Tanacetum coccineum]
MTEDTIPFYEILCSVDDIKAALTRRGPDSIGSKSLYLHAEEGAALRSSVEGSEIVDNCGLNTGKLLFIGATLQLRGENPIRQPLVDDSGNILVYNGEVFGGVELDSDSNDTQVLIESLRKCCNCCSHEHESKCSSSGDGKYSVPELLSTIRGPWALIYWQESSKTIWFGRDALGRRSLLVHWPNKQDSRLMLSSVSPPYAINGSSDFGYENRPSELNFWEELPCGVYSLSMSASENLVGEVRRHKWTDPLLEELIKWERPFVEPKPEDLLESDEMFYSEQRGHLRQEVLAALKESVRRRTIFSRIHQGSSPVAVLFSGGLDSMILAALLHECLDPKC